MADLVREFTRAVGRAYYDSLLHGRLGRLNSDGTYTIQTEDRPAHVYVRMADGTETLQIARNPGIPLQANLPVRMSTQGGELVLEGVNFEALAEVSATPPASGVAVHHHRIGGGLEYELDPRLFEAGRVSGSSGLVAYVNPFRYQKIDGSWDYFAGAHIDLTTHVPGTANEHRWVLVGVNPNDNTALAVAGTAKADSDPLTLAELDDINFLDYIPLGAVRLNNADTDLTAPSRWVDAHGWFNIGTLQHVVDDTTPQLGGDLDAGSFAIQNVDHLKFDVLTAGNEPAFVEGNLYYSEEDKSLTYHTDQSDVQVNIGQESVTRAKNDQGAAITNGQAVYVSGATGGNPDVKLARGDLIGTARATIGLVTQGSIADQAVGYITTLGIVRDLDTSAFTVGDVLYLSPSTAGALTTTQPSYPNFPLRIGVVTRSHASDGSIFVNPYMEREVYSQGSVLFADSIGRIAEDNTNFLWDNTNKHLSLPTIRALDVNGLRLADDAGNLGLFVADGGNVGVGGVPGSTQRLHVFDTGQASVVVNTTDDTSSSWSGFVSSTNGADVSWQIIVHDTLRTVSRYGLTLGGWAELNFTSPQGGVIGTSDNVGLAFATNDVERLRITAAGLLGIGTNSPASELDFAAESAIISLGTGSNNGPHGIDFYDDDDTVGMALYYRTGPETLLVEDSSGTDLLSIDKSGYMQPNALGEAWKAPTFNTGWGNVGAPYYNAGYRLFGDMVMLRGAVERSSGSLQTVFTLPTAYRPSSEVVVAGPVSDITIQTDGDVRVQSVISNGTDVFLDGIWFSI